MFSSDFRPIFFCLIFPISIHPCYHLQITSDCLIPFSYPLSPQSPIVPCTISWLFAYRLVTVVASILYNTSAHKAVVLRAGGLCPLCLLTLLAQSCLAVYKLYQYSTWTLSLSFHTIRTSELKTRSCISHSTSQSHSSLQLHRLAHLPVCISPIPP